MASNINVISVTTKLHNNVTSRHINNQFMKVSNIIVINVTTKVQQKAASGGIKCHLMKVSNMSVINVLTKLHESAVSKPIKSQSMIVSKSKEVIPMPSLPVMIVEHHDGGHNTARHHKHDAVEICSCKNFVRKCYHLNMNMKQIIFCSIKIQ